MIKKQKQRITEAVPCSESSDSEGGRDTEGVYRYVGTFNRD